MRTVEEVAAWLHNREVGTHLYSFIEGFLTALNYPVNLLDNCQRIVIIGGDNPTDRVDFATVGSFLDWFYK